MSNDSKTKDLAELTKAINTAEDILKGYTSTSEKLIETKGKSVLEQVTEYLVATLRECDFTRINIQSKKSEVYNPKVPSGVVVISTGPCYAENGKHYKGALSLCGENSYSSAAVYFNEKEVYTVGTITNDKILVLCYYWKELKEQLNVAIKKSLQTRLNNVKKKSDIQKQHLEIIENFQL